MVMFDNLHGESVVVSLPYITLLPSLALFLNFFLMRYFVSLSEIKKVSKTGMLYSATKVSERQQKGGK